MLSLSQNVLFHYQIDEVITRSSHETSCKVIIYLNVELELVKMALHTKVSTTISGDICQNSMLINNVQTMF